MDEDNYTQRPLSWSNLEKTTSYIRKLVAGFDSNPNPFGVFIMSSVDSEHVIMDYMMSDLNRPTVRKRLVRALRRHAWLIRRGANVGPVYIKITPMADFSKIIKQTVACKKAENMRVVMLRSILSVKTTAPDAKIPELYGKSLPSVFIEYLANYDLELYNYVKKGECFNGYDYYDCEFMLKNIEDNLRLFSQQMIQNNELILTVFGSLWITYEFKSMLNGKGILFSDYLKRARGDK